MDLTGWVKGINVNAQVDGLGQADSVSDLFDDAVHADGVDFAGFNDLEATVAVIVVVAEARECGADAGVDIGVIGQETLFVGVEKVRPVVDRGLEGGGTTEDFGTPCITLESVSSRFESKRGGP